MLLSNLNLLATAPGGVARLRELILTLAVQGKLLPQNPQDEPASVLLKKIRAEKDRLIAEGKIKRDKPLAAIAEDEKPFEVPSGWEWARLGESVEVLDSLRKPVTKSDRKPGPYPYYGASGIVDYVSEYLFDEPLVLVGEDGAKWGRGENTAFVVLGKIWVNNHAHVLRPIRALLSDEFLTSLLTAMDLNQYITGMTVPKLNQARLTSIPLAIPPLAEQTRIVIRVEELMRLCDALETKGQLAAAQHTQLISTLLGTLTDSATPDALAENWQRIASHFDLLLDRPQAVDALEQTILQLAVRGLLVPQDPTDEPARVLLKKIRTEKDRLIAAGQLKRDKPLPPIADDEQPFALPLGWEWARLNDLIRISSGDGLTAAQMTPNSDIPVYGGNGVNGHHDKSNVEQATIVIGRVGYYCGSVHVTPTRAWVTDNAFITRYPKALLDMNWLYWLLIGTNLNEHDSATAQPVISGRKLYPIVVALPPLAEQSRIVTRVESLRRLCADLRQRLSASQSTQAQLAEALVAGVVTS